MTNDIDPADLIPHEDIIYTWENAAGERHEDFDNEQALAFLLLKGHALVNSRWQRTEDTSHIALYVNCSDIFAWACADAQELPYQQLRPLYERVRRDPTWGAAKWYIEQRGEMPQKPVETAIRNAGLWDIDDKTLRPNTSDKQAQAVFAEAAQSNTRRYLRPQDLTESQRKDLRQATVPPGNEKLETLMKGD